MSNAFPVTPSRRSSLPAHSAPFTPALCPGMREVEHLLDACLEPAGLLGPFAVADTPHKAAMEFAGGNDLARRASEDQRFSDKPPHMIDRLSPNPPEAEMIVFGSAKALTLPRESAADRPGQDARQLRPQLAG